MLIVLITLLTVTPQRSIWALAEARLLILIIPIWGVCAKLPDFF